MRALTVRQPWAWAIIHGGKTVENRSRNIAGSYRGPVAIHAGRARDEEAWQDPAIQAATPVDQDGAWEAFRHRRVTGAVIGVADLVAVHKVVDTDLGQGLRGVCCTSPWAQPEASVHLVLANPQPLRTPIPAKGRLGLWTPDTELVSVIIESLGGGHE